MTSAVASRRVRLAFVCALAGTAALAVKDSGDTLRRCWRALVDTAGSNIGDPWPTVVAAGRLADAFHAPVYDDFNAVGSSFIYPPIAALPFTPFAHLGYEGAHAALASVSRVAFVLCIAAAGWLASAPGRRGVGVAFAAACAVGFYPLLRAVELNQSSLIVALLVGGAVILATLGRAAAAGALLAIAAAFKPQLALVVPLLFWRSRALAKGGAVALVAVLCASVAYAGIGNHVRYVHVIGEISGGYSFYPNQSWSALFQRLAGATAFDFALSRPGAAVRALSLVASVATLAVGAWVLRRTAPARADLALHVAFAWLVVNLASPISWEHHYAPAIFVFAVLVRHAWELAPRAIVAASVAFVLVAGFIDVRDFTSVVARAAMSYVMVGGVLLGFAVALTLGRAADEPKLG